MEEDDDAFLYGEDSGGTQEKVVDAGQKVVAEGQSNVAEVAKGEEIAAKDEQEEDDDEDDDDSDSDLEIIVDGNVGAETPVGYNARQQAAPIRNATIQRPIPSVITSEYTPNARPGQSLSVASLAAIAGLDDAASMEQPAGATTQQINSNDFISMNQLPEGGPPPVPITAPRLELDPSEQSLMLPPDTVDGEPGPIIYHVDPTEFEEKPWRRPGADMTDWFNYGFNEDSWRLWGEKKHNRTVERREMEANGGRHDMMNDGEGQESEQNDQGPSNYMSNMPPQQMQAMQAMMGATGMSMSPEQMMAFMGMGSGMGMPGGGMMGMPGMGSMFGQPNANPGIFNGGFGNVPNMQMMQPSYHQNGNLLQQQHQKNDASAEESNGGTEQRQASVINGNATEGANESELETHEQGIQQNNIKEGSQPPNNLAPPRGPRAGSSAARGVGVPGAPTGPSKHASLPKRPATEQAASAASKNIPTGPKNPGRNYNDRDTGMGLADPLDYGANFNNQHRESTPRSPDGRRRQRSNDDQSRDVSIDRDRDHERERERSEGAAAAKSSSRRTRDRKDGHYRRQSSPEEELERLSKRDSRRSDERKSSSTSTSQRYNTSRRGDYRDERRRSASPERDEEWDKESIESSSSRRRTSTRQQQGRSSNRSERRRGAAAAAAEDQADSGSETEKERKHGRSQARSERRAGRAGEESKTSSRKRGAPEDDLSPVRSTTARKRR